RSYDRHRALSRLDSLAIRRARLFQRSGNDSTQQRHRAPRGKLNLSVIIPALNEEESIVGVVRAVAATNAPSEIIVVDNGSSDRTAERARAAGARIMAEPRRGYGRACAAGVRALSPESEIGYARANLRLES